MRKVPSTQWQSTLRGICSMPGLAHAAIDRDELRAMLLGTDGQTLCSGELYEITNKHLGAGVYRVILKRVRS